MPQPWDTIFSLASRVFVWGLIGGILYLLRPFFLLVFLTFVFAYLLEHGVEGLRHRLRNRPARVVLVTVAFLGALTSTGILLAPAFQQQARKIAREFPDYLAKIDAQIDDFRDGWEVAAWLIPSDLRTADVLERAIGAFGPSDGGEAAPRAGREDAEPLPGMVGPPPPYTVVGPPTDDTQLQNRQEIDKAIDKLFEIAGPIFGLASAFLLALLFAFLIVLDLPRLSRATRGLARTKIGFIYEEVAENIHDLGLMLGRALEAQFLIAVCNTVLTAIGLWILGLTPNLVFLSTIVFFFSFIPVVGVFISSAPICFEALSVEGVPLMLGAVVMITTIHMIEAYILNPKIFGHHLHMNPVLVLIVLTVAGNLFGLWGLVLGLPIVNYVFAYAIRRRAQAAATPVAPASTAA
ncbi:MAG: AI-2E family transporter [Planctomycetes bacterium]|nr:AI-2E family transporter [Planctomycetota bacterium]